jgi:hypothetical protein
MSTWHRLQVIAQSRSEVWIALSQFPDGGARKPEGTFSSISFSNCLRVCSVTRGSGLSTPVLKEQAIPRDAEGAIFHGARGKRTCPCRKLNLAGN